MNGYLEISIGIMLLLLVVGQAYESTQISLVGSETYVLDESTGQLIINGSDTTMSIGEQNLIFGISLSEGVMITGIALGALIMLIGISVLGSSISEFAQKAIVNLTLYGAVWGIFSTLTYDLITKTSFFGLEWILFLIISMLHFFGIVKNINGEN